MSILFGVDRKLFFLTRSARPFFNDGARNLDALPGKLSRTTRKSSLGLRKR